ncbi:sigma54 specific transcriptional regulator, Fis family [Alkaliphilus metalliredigens QYMF]|uniref:Sigma54 specific transcriptional regulator, Fis family n=1 Tax=Alkaliphilus metalliredigens (strain QYMF) TaxID=293826 RepID=A6TWQ8_ALKMQ|nr:sigma-54-dependent Fis family transcriptional regulator [Alkaliphilus metalliredigens]ABR50626.1 sigma54 specific transcriptional regulator, Fis family [Alkaliphilus metalliredigens QYMF]
MNKIFTPQNLLSILDYVKEGVQIIDHRGTIVYCNPATAQLDNVSRVEAEGRSILEIYPSLTEETSTLLQVIETGEPIFDVQQTFVNYLGHKIITTNSSIPLKEKGKVIGALEISQDITQVKALSEKLVDLQRKLYRGEKHESDESKGTAKYTFVDIIGRSREIQRLKTRALKAANTPSSIMIYGSTGTGKELIVQSIHNASDRRNQPFIAQNCAAIPATLLESILFGTVKGSFTDAEDRSGLFELANGGTLFLDEINSMPIELQAKLLRVLEEHSIRRVGDIRTRPVDVRIIAAMNMDPLQAVDQHHLRSDLFYRLSVVSLRVPDLRERKEDIPYLVAFFIKKFNKRLQKKVQGISKEVIEIFNAHQWPGNVRELEHIIEGAMNILEDDLIHEEDLPYYIQDRMRLRGIQEGMEDHLSLRERLQSVEKQLIEKALGDTNKNVSKAAKQLAIPRQTLQYKMEKFKIK